VLKSSQEIMHDNTELKTNVSEIFSVSIIRVEPNDGLKRSLKCWFLVQH
jgi:hypothetical protein